MRQTAGFFPADFGQVGPPEAAVALDQVRQRGRVVRGRKQRLLALGAAFIYAFVLTGLAIAALRWKGVQRWRE